MVEITQQRSGPTCEQCLGHGDDLQHLCLTHFITASYKKLEELKASIQRCSFGDPACESARRFTRECSQIATDFSTQKSDLSNLERARLADIALWSVELGQSLPRSPRSPLRIAIRLISDIPGRGWQEDTFTLDVNRHGARMTCENAVKQDDVFKVLRLDSGEQVESRVVWRDRTSAGIQEIGVEIIGNKNFWAP